MFCIPQKGHDHVNQHFPFESICGESEIYTIEEIYDSGNRKVSVGNFNEIVLKIGSKDKREGAKVDLKDAIVMQANAQGNGKTTLGKGYDVGIIVSKDEIIRKEMPLLQAINMPER